MVTVKKTTSGTNKKFVFKYKPRTPEEIRARVSRHIGGRDSYFKSDIQFFTPREGSNNVRILPPPPDSEWGHYGINIAVHYDIGADKNAYLCASEMDEGKCPICEERSRAVRANEDELVKALKPSFRVAVYVIDRSQEGKGPLLWNIPAGLDNDIAKLCVDPGSGEYLAVDDPADGYDLSFTREGQGLKTKYKALQFSRRSSPLSDDEDESDNWLKFVVENPIDQCLLRHEYDYIRGVFSAESVPQAESEEEEDETRKIATSTKKTTEKKAQKKQKVEEEDVEEEETNTDGDTITRAELDTMDEDELIKLGEDNDLHFPKSFDSLDDLRDWVGDKLGIAKADEEDGDDDEEEESDDDEEEEEDEKPTKGRPQIATKKSSAAPASWRDKLTSKTKRK